MTVALLDQEPVVAIATLPVVAHEGTGDFDGDGKSDILWQHSDGTPAIWLMDGPDATLIAAAGPLNPGMDWHVIV